MIPVFTHDPKIVDGGLDWVTFTTVDGESTVKAIKHASALADSLARDNVEKTTWKGLGYTGYKTEHVRYGIRGQQEGIIIVSGPYSSKLLSEQWFESGRATRVDTQVTVLLDKPQPRVGYKLYRDLEGLNKTRKRQRPIKLIKSPTGDTLYVGKRTSGVMLRFYDKSLDYGESELGTIWRFEVEYKQAHARKACKRILDANDLLGCCAGLTLAEFQKRDVEPGFSPETFISAIEVGATVTTVDNKLKWLTKCVAPVVVQLVIAGYEEEVVSALKLRGLVHWAKEKNDGIG